MVRLERILKEISRKEEQLTVLQNELKGLRAMKAQCEDAELLKMLHTMKMNKEDLLRFVQERKENITAAESALEEREETMHE